MTNRPNHIMSRRHGGFTLLELSISILIIAIVVGGLIGLKEQQDRASQKKEMDRKLEMISAALYNYRVVNNKLPCPSNSSNPRGSADFGKEADGGAELCNAASTAALSSNINTLSNDIFGGGVPVRTLGLPDDAAFDPMGNQFTYYVDKKATNPCNFLGNRLTTGFVDTDKLNVQDESGTPLDEQVIAVVISHGKNGHGAYNAAGQRVSSGSTNAAEQGNCMCDASADPTSPVPSTLLVRIQRLAPTDATDLKTNFDDVGRFYNKAFFFTYNEKTR